MIFLIEYDRRKGRIVALRRFAEKERPTAERARLDLELTHSGQQVDHEIVILEATTEEALRRTHRRYFENTRQIIESST